MRKYCRRGFVGILLASLFRPRRLKGQPGTTDGTPARSISRTYRADAVILFLGISIYRRPGVGSGQASIDETGEGASLRRTFFFAGGSDPKRAHGLSRLGWMREVVVGPVSAPTETNYFGVLTSSPEESLEHARKSVAAPPSGRSIFSAVSGRNTPGHSRSALTHFEYATGSLWSDRGLIEHAQTSFQSSIDWHESSWPKSSDQAPPTFLWQMATLLKQRTRAAARYVYNEQEYSLQLEPLPAGADREHHLPFRGKIRNLHTGREYLFRVWLEQGSDSIVPIRIEFQARSFLRLTFEAVPA